jgi:hypothetical protein
MASPVFAISGSSFQPTPFARTARLKWSAFIDTYPLASTKPLT